MERWGGWRARNPESTICSATPWALRRASMGSPRLLQASEMMQNDGPISVLRVSRPGLQAIFSPPGPNNPQRKAPPRGGAPFFFEHVRFNGAGFSLAY